jgi:predicted ArsR family transcriptional regulator
MRPVTTTRKLILDYLQKKHLASATELGHALKMTSANARHHLGVLIEEGAVEVAMRRPIQGRGRPEQLYTLTLQAHSHNLDSLASALLRYVFTSQPGEDRSNALSQVAGSLASVENPKTAANLTQRLYQAVQHLNEMGYQARWEAHSEAPRLLLGHCPYAAILPEHPELCQMDAFLVESLLGTPARQAKKLAQDSRGARYCLFIAGRGR